MLVRLSAIAAVAALTACSSAKPVMGPNGKQAFFVKCPAGSPEACYEEAAKACPSGYVLLDKGAVNTGAVVPVGGVLVASRGPNTMLVECKG